MNYEDKTTYKGYTIEATLDQCPENPLLDWDHGVTLVTDDNHLFYNTDQRTGLPTAPDLTKDQARSLIPDLMREAEYTSTKQWLLDNHFCTNNETSILDWLNDEYLPSYIEDEDSLNRLHQVYEVTGTQSVLVTSTGYSQGDRVEMLVIADDDYYTMTGCDPKEDQTESLTSVANTYGHWRWGDVYGYEVTKAAHCDACGSDEPEVLDSGNGFYGPDHDENGLLAEAKAFIDSLN